MRGLDYDTRAPAHDYVAVDDMPGVDACRRCAKLTGGRPAVIEERLREAEARGRLIGLQLRARLIRTQPRQ